jgi:hypothetical protein
MPSGITLEMKSIVIPYTISCCRVPNINEVRPIAKDEFDKINVSHLGLWSAYHPRSFIIQMAFIIYWILNGIVDAVFAILFFGVYLKGPYFRE